MFVIDDFIKVGFGILIGAGFTKILYKRKKRKLRKAIERLDYITFKNIIYDIKMDDQNRRTRIYTKMKKKYFFDDDILDNIYGLEVFMMKFDPLFFQRKRLEEKELNIRKIVRREVELSMIRGNDDYLDGLIGGYSTDDEESC